MYTGIYFWTIYFVLVENSLQYIQGNVTFLILFIRSKLRLAYILTSEIVCVIVDISMDNCMLISPPLHMTMHTKLDYFLSVSTINTWVSIVNRCQCVDNWSFETCIFKQFFYHRYCILLPLKSVCVCVCVCVFVRGGVVIVTPSSHLKSWEYVAYPSCPGSNKGFFIHNGRYSC